MRFFLLITCIFSLNILQIYCIGLPLVSKRNESYISPDDLPNIRRNYSDVVREPEITQQKMPDGSQYDNMKFDNEKCRYRISKGYITMEGQTRRLTGREINQLDQYYQQRTLFNQAYSEVSEKISRNTYNVRPEKIAVPNVPYPSREALCLCSNC